MATPSKPRFFDTPIAANGDKNTITGDTTATDVVSIKYGFPSKFSTPRDSGGKSVARRDMNGLLNDITSLNYYFQYMGRNPWVDKDSYGVDVSYPIGAKVWYNDAEYISNTDGNTSTPGSSSTWIKINDLTGTIGGASYDDTWIRTKFSTIDTQISALSGQVQEISGSIGTSSYPVGFVFISTNYYAIDENRHPTADSGFPFAFGTWTKIADGNCLWNTDTESEVNQPLSGVLPKHYHTDHYRGINTGGHGAASGNIGYVCDGGDLDTTTTGTGTVATGVSNVTMGTTLRPVSIGVTMWIRTA